MKQLIFSLILSSFALSGFSATPACDAPFKSVVNKDSGFIYIYRVGQFGGALANFSIFVDGKKLCKISNNKYFKVYVTAGTHEISAKVGGVSIMKKETSIEVETTKGGEFYVACNMKQSITRVRLEMVEVVKNSAKKQMENMSEDRCQGKIED